MRRPLALSVLAAALSSCASPPALYETEDADAVPIYRSLIGSFPNLPAVVRSAFDRDPVEGAKLAAAMSPYDAVLTDLARAARARRCEWTHEKPQGITDPFPIDYALTAARVLVVRSRLRFAKGEVDAALEDLLVTVRLGSDLQQEQWLIGKLIGNVALMFAAFELQDRIQASVLEDRHLSLIEASLSSADRRYPPFETWLKDERRMALLLVDVLRDAGFQETLNRLTRVSGGTQDPSDDGSFVVAAWDGWLRAVLKNDFNGTRSRIALRWREQLAPLEAEVRKPVNARDYEAAMEKLAWDSTALSQRMVRHMARGTTLDDAALNDVSDLILGIWRPHPVKLERNNARVRTTIRFIEPACRLERYRRRYGSYPASIEKVGGAPIDPYTGDPVAYQHIVRPDGEGYVLAAAGPKDDTDIRIRRLVEECRFDRELFEKKNIAAKDDDADPLTWGVFRTRDSLR